MHSVPQGMRRELDVLGLLMLALGGTGDAGVIDADGVYSKLFETLGAVAALIRPDFVLYGHAATGDLPDLLHGFVQQVRGQTAAAGSRQLAPA